MKVTITKPLGYIVESYDDFEYYKSTKEFMLSVVSYCATKEEKQNFYNGLLTMSKLEHNVGEFGDFEKTLIFSSKE